MVTSSRPTIAKTEQNLTRDGITRNFSVELELQRKQISDIERRLEIFSSPQMQIKMSTLPRNKIDLHCQPLANSYTPTKKFSASYPGKAITTRCTFGKFTDSISEKIEVETEVEELNPNIFVNKQCQTEATTSTYRYIDDDDDYYVYDDADQLTTRANSETNVSTRFAQYGTILTQNEVDRIASDGDRLLYYSDTTKTLCCITEVIPTKLANGASTTKEISCRWPYFTILDMVYCPGSLQFVCATKTGVYTCTVLNSIIDIRMQLSQTWSYIRLAADKNFVWIWTDTPKASQLRAYTPRTFELIKVFNLNEYPRFLDNSTSFCMTSNILATLFQFRPASNLSNYRKLFHLTLCDSNDLREICTIRLGECDIDHEVRVNNQGLFFITNGRKRLWIVDQHGKKEYIKLFRIGRALTIHSRNMVVIANGTQQLQCVELINNE